MERRRLELAVFELDRTAGSRGAAGFAVRGEAYEKLARALESAGVRSAWAAPDDQVPPARPGEDGSPAAGSSLGSAAPAAEGFSECRRRFGTDRLGAVAVVSSPLGARSARGAGYALVVGAAAGGGWLALREAGADWIVATADELSVERLERQLAAREHARPNALHFWPRLTEQLRGARLSIALDYDGTLTPIVDRPEQAALAPGMRETLRRLAVAWPTQVISGRGLDDIRRLVGIDSIWMAGSHGFDIGAPAGEGPGKQAAPEAEPEVHAAAEELRRRTAGLAGVLVEDKRLAIAVHYRLAKPHEVGAIERIVDEVAERHPALRKTLGKMVFQLQPALDWDKGKALNWLLEVTGQRDAFPIFIGDDLTDEDGFAVLQGRGLGILVAELPRPTAARYSLQSPAEVQVFLERLAALAGPAGRD